MRSKGELSGRAMYRGYVSLTKDDVSLLTFLTVVEDFNKRVVDLLLAGKNVKLPFNLGEVYIEKRKVNYEKLHLDYGHWRASGGEKVYHTNRHSDGYHAYFHWKKLSSFIVHKGLYKFIPARGNSRSLAKLMKTEGGHKRYISYERAEKVAPRPALLSN